MAEEPDVIRQQIDVTRESLTEKLDALEGQVKGVVGTVTDTIETVRSTVENTVESVKSGVEDTVESVKTSFSDTVDSVKETLDLSHQIDRHPWGAVGCSLLAGVAAGYLLTGSRRNHSYFSEGIPGITGVIPGYQPGNFFEAPRQEPRESPAEPGMLASLLEPFAGEFEKIKRTAIGALIGMGRDALKQALPPSLAANVNEIMDDVTRHIGGEPVRGPVLEESDAANGARRSTVY